MGDPIDLSAERARRDQRFYGDLAKTADRILDELEQEMSGGDSWRTLLTVLLTRYVVQTPPERRDELVASLRLLAREVKGRNRR